MTMTTKQMPPHTTTTEKVAPSRVIEFEARVTNTISQHGQPTPPLTPPIGLVNQLPPLPSIEVFIASLVTRSQVQVPTLLSSFVYLDRLRARLPRAVKGIRFTVHRIFLGSFILAAKSLSDSSPKNKHWARYTVVKGYDGFGFSLSEAYLMERQLLSLLDWETRVTEKDLLTYLDPFLAPIRRRLQAQGRQRKAKEEEEFQWKQENREWLVSILFLFYFILDILIKLRRRHLLHPSTDLLASHLCRPKSKARGDNNNRRTVVNTFCHLTSHISFPSIRNTNN